MAVSLLSNTAARSIAFMIRIHQSRSPDILFTLSAAQDPSDSKVAEVYARIQTQRRIMEGNQALRAATSNQTSFVRQNLRFEKRSETSPTSKSLSQSQIASRKRWARLPHRQLHRRQHHSEDPRQSFASSMTSVGSSASAGRPYPGDSSSSTSAPTHPRPPSMLVDTTAVRNRQHPSMAGWWR